MKSVLVPWLLGNYQRELFYFSNAQPARFALARLGVTWYLIVVAGHFRLMYLGKATTKKWV